MNDTEYLQYCQRVGLTAKTLYLAFNKSTQTPAWEELPQETRENWVNVVECAAGMGLKLVKSGI